MSSGEPRHGRPGITPVTAEAPVTEVQRRAAGMSRSLLWRFRLIVTAFVLGLCFLVFAGWMALQIFWYYGGRSYADIDLHFRHGSIGAELANGMPLRMLKVLPKIFPEHFGATGDWRHFGLIMETADDEGRRGHAAYEGGRLVRDDELRPAEALRRAAARAEAAHGLPIGFASGWRLGIEVAWFNCAVCHTGVVHVPGETKPRVVPGMPANTVDLERLFLALFDMAVDKRFTYAEFARAFEGSDRLWFYEVPLWNWLVVPNVRAELISRRSDLLALLAPERAPPMKREAGALGEPAMCQPSLRAKPGCPEAIHLQPYEPYRRQRPPRATSWGPGRVDTFNPYKLIYFEMEADCLKAEERIGVADFPAIFEQGERARRVMHLHWDGNNASIHERNLSAALGAGVSESTVNHDSLARIVRWLDGLKPPPSPYAASQVADSVARGRAIYRQVCESCHGYQGPQGYVFEGERLGRIEPQPSLGTDRHRLDSYTSLMEKYQKDRLFCSEPEHRFRQFKKTDGYANLPLDGLWLRAPYLHNGSVPTLRDLLRDPKERPTAFMRGADHILLDPLNGGFAAPGCIPSKDTQRPAGSFCFDTSEPGNSKEGHTYGTDLSEAQKSDLLAYLLTF